MAALGVTPQPRQQDIPRSGGASLVSTRGSPAAGSGLGPAAGGTGTAAPASGQGLAAAASLCLRCNFGCGWSLLRGQADWAVFLCFTISYVVL